MCFWSSLSPWFEQRAPPPYTMIYQRSTCYIAKTDGLSILFPVGEFLRRHIFFHEKKLPVNTARESKYRRQWRANHSWLPSTRHRFHQVPTLWKFW
ncbi:hypothetical protein HanXRQr2_Chr12g0526021 [Helianthus annuus]|uniref:Uncharacterized protein n=1 Tax=Helianthus annuus TaxID=4232 RepID=A0A9K3EQC9_HELAN|nr:hypothetical protein HanXRQr2_Chr12g0526021 [Helianthus annuus]